MGKRKSTFLSGDVPNTDSSDLAITPHMIEMGVLALFPTCAAPFETEEDVVRRVYAAMENSKYKGRHHDGREQK